MCGFLLVFNECFPWKSVENTSECATYCEIKLQEHGRSVKVTSLLLTPMVSRLSSRNLFFLLLPAVVAGASTWPTINCGPACVLQIRPWCLNSLRVRMILGEEEVLDNLPGALSSNIFCGNEDIRSARITNNSFTYGSITATWDGGGLRFLRGQTPLLSTLGSISQAFSIVPASSPSSSPAPGPAPAPYACQDSCTLGDTGIQQQTDATNCGIAGLAHPKLLNITRSACCAACVNATKCQAWAWGRDSADTGHRHNCYLCSSLAGTTHRSDRDFGCVERTDADAEVQTQTQTRYYQVGAAFESSSSEFLTGLGQHSYVPRALCSTGKGCGQWKLNQKGFIWPLRITKFQIMIPLLMSNRQYGFFWNAPGEGEDEAEAKVRVRRSEVNSSNVYIIIP